ncbi:acetyl-CoA hydrolase/transferase family protein [Burkholderia sp. Ac-20345]|uniref:acetyl-CoA hydrolase/transferase family protein n=1 Tax=Burkholderia sp. Ac-20345 TaxID=2703891 RepID=UPI00197B397E|nr:acetyl-CoA hydrolase/transferase family protein [Burkholderia sp. Ac-20345]MBN3777987.1 acetyl-CoA hydrolase/transferase family protein [Burkholderia sp. Ac-20345]
MEMERIRCNRLRSRVTTAEEAAALIRDGMTIGMSGFGYAGDCKRVPFALAQRAASEATRVTLITSASLGHDIDKVLADANVTTRRMPFQSDGTLRRKINAGAVMYIDQHLSEMVEQLRGKYMGPMDVAVIEATAITESGGIVPTTSVGASADFAAMAKHVIVEINLNMPMELEGLHDVYVPVDRPHRLPIPLIAPEQRVGLPFIQVDPEKIAAIVFTQLNDSPTTLLPSDEDTQNIARHLNEFLVHEVRAGRLAPSLQPLQVGVGTISNSVLNEMVDSPFSDLRMYSEILQDSTIALLDSGRLRFASACAIALSESVQRRFLAEIDRYRSRLVLRPQEISNHPEVIRRLGVIAINTALECDIYGNVNSTHVGGTHMMNGIGGSGDFARNAHLSVFVTKSIAKDGDISSIVPMVSHVDHTEHDVDIIVTEHGLADLRGLAPRERASQIIEKCADPLYRDALRDYVKRAGAMGGQTPHVLEEALAWHVQYRDDRTMRKVIGADCPL